MNRAERRRQKRETTKEGVINIKKKDIAKIKQDATDEAVQKAFAMMLYISGIVLRDKWGFGRKRLDQFFDYTLEQFDAIQQQYVSFEDIQKAIKEETGLEIER